MNACHIQAKSVSLISVDRTIDDLSAVVSGVDIIYHVSAQPKISATNTFQTYVDNNITATYRLLKEAKQVNSGRGFINISTSSVYGTDATGDETTEPQPTL